MSTSARTVDRDFTRPPRRPRPRRIPTPVTGEPGLFVVDSTWGTIAPMELAPGVRTVGELEVMAHICAGGDVVDTRVEEMRRGASIPGARWIPHDEIVEQVDLLSSERPTVFFCNGPQCSATPQAVRDLLDAGHPPELILYYRGGLHDWVTLGLPTAAD